MGVGKTYSYLAENSSTLFSCEGNDDPDPYAIPGLNAIFLAAIIRYENGDNLTNPPSPRDGKGIFGYPENHVLGSLPYDSILDMASEVMNWDLLMAAQDAGLDPMSNNVSVTYLPAFGKNLYTDNPEWAPEVKKVMDGLYAKCGELGFTVNDSQGNSSQDGNSQGVVDIKGKDYLKPCGLSSQQLATLFDKMAEDDQAPNRNLCQT